MSITYSITWCIFFVSRVGCGVKSAVFFYDTQKEGAVSSSTITNIFFALSGGDEVKGTNKSVNMKAAADDFSLSNNLLIIIFINCFSIKCWVITINIPQKPRTLLNMSLVSFNQQSKIPIIVLCLQGCKTEKSSTVLLWRSSDQRLDFYL